MHQTLGDAMFSLGQWIASAKFEDQVDLEENYRKYVAKVVPLVEAVKESLA
jgi:hypothetical protein